MKVEHTLQMSARCPVNGLQDVYEVTVTFDRIVKVEDLLEYAATLGQERIFQEDLTTKICLHFRPCKVKTVGIHSGVRTVVYDDATSDSQNFGHWEPE